MTFHQPSIWLLMLLALLPIIWWRRGDGRRRAAIRFSSVALAEDAGRSWAMRLRFVVPALRGLALVLLVVCLARPQKANERTRVRAEGIAIQLIVDRSGSMLAEDFEVGGRATSRLEAVKKVVREFVEGGEGLPGRPDDLIGLITFATWADSLCPLTLDHRHLIEAVRQTEVSADEKDQATAIGDAIALGVERMAGLDARSGSGPGRGVQSKVMIILTDGESNAGEIDPLTAARMAAALEIRIYTIGAGTPTGFAPVPATDPFTGTRFMRRVPVSIDERTLREIADVTEGHYFRATDSRSLQEVYARIDELERSEVAERRYVDYREAAVEPVRLGRVSLPPLLCAVLMLLVVEALLSGTRFRALP
jgi:Ca-activated chloride channel family protein